MGNGLILAFVVVVWAAYFVPLALRRYDEASKNSSVESFTPLSRVIARRSTAEHAAEDGPVLAEETPVDEGPVETARRTPDRPAARLAARRRRRTLLTLLAVTAVVVALAGFSVIAVAWIAAPVALVVAWLIACRVQVRGERGLSRRRMPRTVKLSRPGKARRKVAEPRSVDEEETVIVSGQFEDINPGRKHQMEDVPLEADALDDKIVIAVPSVSTTGEALWDPLPVTVPTYVTKPRAGRTVRTIDFSQAGTWTSGHIEGEDVELPQRKDADADPERRAVGH